MIVKGTTDHVTASRMTNYTNSELIEKYKIYERHYILPLKLVLCVLENVS